MFILSPLRVSVFLHSQDPKRHLAGDFGAAQFHIVGARSCSERLYGIVSAGGSLAPANSKRRPPEGGPQMQSVLFFPLLSRRGGTSIGHKGRMSR
jgi:hypothetical protein